MAKKYEIDIDVNTGQAIKNVDKLNDSLEKTTNNTEDLTDEVTKNGGAMAILNQLTGGLAQQFKDSYEAIAVSTKGLSGFRKALVATGIGAAVVAIGLLVENWDRLKEIITGTTRAQKAYKESIDKIVGSVTEMNTKIIKMEDTIQLAKEGFIDKEDALKQYNEALGESFGYAQSLNEAEALMVANSAIVIENTKLKAQAEVLYAKAAEGRAKVLAGDETLEPSFWQSLGNAILGFGDASTIAGKNAESVAKNIGDVLEVSVEFENEAERLQRQILENEKQLKTGGLSPDAIKKLQEKNQKLKDESDKLAEEQRKKAQEAEKARVDFLLAQREALAIDEEQRFQLELTKTQERYNALIEQAQKYNLDTFDLEFAKEEALQQLRDNFEAARLAKEKANADKELADKQAQADAIDKIEADKRAAQMQTLDQAISIANEESALGKALLVAKQILAAKEAIIDAKATASKAAQAVADAGVKAAGAGVDISAGAAKTASSAPFPANIPLIIAYAAQAVGIIASIRAATSKMKSAVPSGGGISIGAPSVPQATVPQVNTVGSSGVNQLASVVESSMNRPIKAFVVSKDVSTAQEMDRNIISQAGI